MTTDYKVTELFCIIDEFCKHFDAENAGNLLEDNSGVKRRRRQASLSDSEIMTILLYFHFGTFRFLCLSVGILQCQDVHNPYWIVFPPKARFRTDMSWLTSLHSARRRLPTRLS